MFRAPRLSVQRLGANRDVAPGVEVKDRLHMGLVLGKHVNNATHLART
jgi:hypothetical protein